MINTDVLLYSVAMLPGGSRHGLFPQMWQFKKIIGRGKFVAVSGRRMAAKGPQFSNVAVESYCINLQTNWLKNR
jgi:hypothetical protein